jgi:hypothetical protein
MRSLPPPPSPPSHPTLVDGLGAEAEAPVCDGAASHDPSDPVAPRGGGSLLIDSPFPPTLSALSLNGCWRVGACTPLPPGLTSLAVLGDLLHIRPPLDGTTFPRGLRELVMEGGWNLQRLIDLPLASLTSLTLTECPGMNGCEQQRGWGGGIVYSHGGGPCCGIL